MSEFSPTGLDLDRPFHTSNWVAFMFWIMVIMGLILFYSLVRHHGWFIKLSKYIFGKAKKLPMTVFNFLCGTPSGPRLHQVYNSMWGVYEPNNSISQEDSSKELQMELLNPGRNQRNVPIPDLHPLTHANPTGEAWKTTQALYGNWQMRAVLKNKENKSCPLYYNPISRAVIDQQGKTMQDITPPTQEDIDHFYSIVLTSKAPPTNSCGDTIRHRDYPSLRYSKRLKTWINEETQSSVPGLNAPEGFSLQKPNTTEPTYPNLD